MVWRLGLYWECFCFCLDSILAPYNKLEGLVLACKECFSFCLASILAPYNQLEGLVLAFYFIARSNSSSSLSVALLTITHRSVFLQNIIIMFKKCLCFYFDTKNY